MEAVDSEMVDFEMILLGGRIFVILLAMDGEPSEGCGTEGG